MVAAKRIHTRLTPDFLAMNVQWAREPGLYQKYPTGGPAIQMIEEQQAHTASIVRATLSCRNSGPRPSLAASRQILQTTYTGRTSADRESHTKTNAPIALPKSDSRYCGEIQARAAKPPLNRESTLMATWPIDGFQPNVALFSMIIGHRNQSSLSRACSAQRLCRKPCSRALRQPGHNG